MKTNARRLTSDGWRPWPQQALERDPRTQLTPCDERYVRQGLSRSVEDVRLSGGGRRRQLARGLTRPTRRCRWSVFRDASSAG